MTDLIKTLIALDDGVDPELVRAALPEGQSDIQIVGMVHGLDETWRILQETTTDLLVIACAGHSDRALFLVDAAVKQRPERPVVVLSEGSANGFIRRLFEAGADDIVLLPEPPDRVRFTLEKALARKQGSAVATGIAVAPMICVLGPKGGSGKTVTASNLTVGLAMAGYSVALVDLDLQFGDVGLALGLPPNKTIYDLAKSGGSIDAEKIEAYLAEHESGARVLLAPTRPDHDRRHGRLPAGRVLGPEAVLRLRGRRHAPWLHPGGDRLDRQLDAHLPGGNARLAVTQEHQARARDARPDGV